MSSERGVEQKEQGAEPRVTVVIPNWNGLLHLEECFLALSRQVFRSFSIVFVDNASTDGSVQWVRDNVPDADLVCMAKNGGFSYAVNEGIRRATTEYVVLLNNDTSADPYWLQELVKALDERDDYDIAASRMLFYERPHLTNAAGDHFVLTRLEARNRGFGRPAERYDEEKRVFGACAGAALYRRRLFDEIGLFDEDFFLMSEDTDINFRALLAGRKCLYVPTAKIRHKIGATIKTQPAEAMIRLAFRNQAYLVAKDFPAALLPLAVGVWPWRTLRAIVPLKPAYWKCIPENAWNARLRVRSEVEGVVMGLKRRISEPVPRKVSTLTVLRWLAWGAGRP